MRNKSMGRTIIREKIHIKWHCLLYEILVGWFVTIRLLSSTYITSFLGTDISMWLSWIKWMVGIPLLIFSVFKMSVSKLTKKQVLALVSMLAFICGEIFFIHDTTFIFSIIFMLTLPEDLPIKHLAKLISYVYFILIFYIICNCYMGNIMDYSFFQRGVWRHSLGFVSANAFANIVAIGYTIYMYYKIETWDCVDSVILLIVSAFVYKTANSRLATLMLLAVFLFAQFYPFIVKKRISKMIYTLSSFLFPLLSIVMYTVTSYFASRQTLDSYQTINEIFSQRLEHAVGYYKDYGIQLFGKPIEGRGIALVVLEGGHWRGLDNSYMMIAIQFGMFALILFCIGYIMTGYILKQKQDFAGAFLLILFSIQGITENYLYAIHYNFTLFIIAEGLLYRKERYLHFGKQG